MRTKIIKRSKLITITMKKKGQMSLEMIIGLLILLVVAVVVIRIFLQSMSGAEDLGVKNELAYKNFKSNCESLCSNYKASGTRATLAKYCYTDLGNIDLNENGIIDKLTADTKILPICEDGIYCFHVTECETDYGVIDWDDCRKVVCESYEDIYSDEATIDRKVSELFELGSCDGISNDENWVKLYFDAGNGRPCTSPPDSPCIISIDSCEIDTTNSPITFDCTGSISDQPSLHCNARDFAMIVADSDDSSTANIAGASPDAGTGSVTFTYVDGVSDEISGTLGMYQGTSLTTGDCQGGNFGAGIYYIDIENPIVTFGPTNCQIS